MKNTQISERIASARATKGYSTAQLAQRMGVKKSTVENWEKGRSIPRANRLNTVAGILNVPLAWLLGGSDALDKPSAPDDATLLTQKLNLVDTKFKELGALIAEVRTISERL